MRHCLIAILIVLPAAASAQTTRPATQPDAPPTGRQALRDLAGELVDWTGAQRLVVRLQSTADKRLRPATPEAAERLMARLDRERREAAARTRAMRAEMELALARVRQLRAAHEKLDERNVPAARPEATADARAEAARRIARLNRETQQAEQAADVLARQLEIVAAPAMSDDEQLRKLQDEAHQRIDDLARARAEMIEVQSQREYLLVQVELLQADLAARTGRPTTRPDEGDRPDRALRKMLEVYKVQLAGLKEMQASVKESAETVPAADTPSCTRAMQLEAAEYVTQLRLRIAAMENQIQAIQQALDPDSNTVGLRLPDGGMVPGLHYVVIATFTDLNDAWKLQRALEALGHPDITVRMQEGQAGTKVYPVRTATGYNLDTAPEREAVEKRLAQIKSDMKELATGELRGVLKFDPNDRATNPYLFKAE